MTRLSFSNSLKYDTQTFSVSNKTREGNNMCNDWQGRNKCSLFTKLLTADVGSPKESRKLPRLTRLQRTH